MDPLQFLNADFVIFSLGIFCIIFTVRTLSEYFLPQLKVSPLWNELFLTLAPIILGAGIGILAKKFPFADGLTTFSGRAFEGAVAGVLSGIAYKVIKGLLISKTTSYIDQSPTNTVNNQGGPGNKQL